MRKGQPDRADLLPAGRDVVDDAARDDEMRLRVVVGEDEVRAQEDDPRGRAGRRGSRREQPRGAIYNHESRSGYPGPLKSFINWIYGVALALGGPGLFTIAFLDSSFISLPQINDILVVLMVHAEQGVDAVLRADGDARLDRRLLRHLLPGGEGRRDVSAASVSRPGHIDRALGALPAATACSR